MFLKEFRDWWKINTEETLLSDNHFHNNSPTFYEMFENIVNEVIMTIYFLKTKTAAFIPRANFDMCLCLFSCTKILKVIFCKPFMTLLILFCSAQLSHLNIKTITLWTTVHCGNSSFIVKKKSVFRSCVDMKRSWLNVQYRKWTSVVENMLVIWLKLKKHVDVKVNYDSQSAVQQ